MQSSTSTPCLPPAFSLPPAVLTPPVSTFRGVPLRRYTARTATQTAVRMEISTPTPFQSPQVAPMGAFDAFPPPEMTLEWAEAVQRLAGAVPDCSLSQADEVLEAAEGDEGLALRWLTESNKTEVQKERERVVEEARKRGDVNRVSAMKEAELRRRATGSASEFFKGYVEVSGQHVEQGYVDEDADAMGKMMKAVGKWFGK